MRSRDPIHMQHRKVKQINNCLGFKVRARVDFKWPQWAKMYGKYSTIGWWWWYLTTISIMCKSNSGWAGRWGQLLQCIVTITRKNQAVLRLTVHLLKETRQTSWEQALQTQQLKKMTWVLPKAMWTFIQVGGEKRNSGAEDDCWRACCFPSLLQNTRNNF